jgi:hypothetical protein
MTQASKDLSAQSQQQADALSAQADNCVSESCYQQLNAAADAQRAGGYATTPSGDVLAPGPNGGITVYTPKSALAAMRAPVEVEAKPKPVHCGWSVTCRVSHLGIVKSIANMATAASDILGDVGGVVAVFCAECGAAMAAASFGLGVVAAGADAYDGDWGEAAKVLVTAGIGLVSFGLGSFARSSAEAAGDGIGVTVRDGINGGFVDSIRNPETEQAVDKYTGEAINTGYPLPKAWQYRTTGAIGVATVGFFNGTIEYNSGDFNPNVEVDSQG